MAKFVISKVGDKHNRKVKVVKERVEFHVLPLIGCFLLAVGIWMFVVGTQIRENELRTAQTIPPAGAETTQQSDLQASGHPEQQAHDTPEVGLPENGTPSRSS